MAQQEGNLRARYAEDREYLERLLDLEHLLEATLSGFGYTSALASEDPDVTVDVFGRVHQVEPARLVADKRRRKAARCEVLFADSTMPRSHPG